MERIASVFRNDRSQAVRIPKEFELPGNEVTIERQADGSLILRPRLSLSALVRTFEPLASKDALDPVPALDAEDIDL